MGIKSCKCVAILNNGLIIKVKLDVHSDLIQFKKMLRRIPDIIRVDPLFIAAEAEKA